MTIPKKTEKDGVKNTRQMEYAAFILYFKMSRSKFLLNSLKPMNYEIWGKLMILQQFFFQN